MDRKEFLPIIILLIGMGIFVPGGRPLHATSSSSDIAQTAAPDNGVDPSLLSLSIHAAQADSSFIENLYFGASDLQVSKLQEFLTAQGDYSGPISGNFFSLTLAGVKQFQIAQDIAPPTGYFGPITRAKANGILLQQAPAQSSSTQSASAPPAITSADASSMQAELNSLIAQVRSYRASSALNRK